MRCYYCMSGGLKMLCMSSIVHSEYRSVRRALVLCARLECPLFGRWWRERAPSAPSFTRLLLRVLPACLEARPGNRTSRTYAVHYLHEGAREIVRYVLL